MTIDNGLGDPVPTRGNPKTDASEGNKWPAWVVVLVYFWFLIKASLTVLMFIIGMLVIFAVTDYVPLQLLVMGVTTTIMWLVSIFVAVIGTKKIQSMLKL